MNNYEMQKVNLSLEEIGLLEICLRLVYDSIDRGDAEDLTSNEEYLEYLEEYNSQGYFDNLIEVFSNYGPL